MAAQENGTIQAFFVVSSTRVKVRPEDDDVVTTAVMLLMGWKTPDHREIRAGRRFVEMHEAAESTRGAVIVVERRVDQTFTLRIERPGMPAHRLVTMVDYTESEFRNAWADLLSFEPIGD